MGRNFSSCKFVWITRCQEIVCIGEYYADCSSHVWFSSKITRKMLYACAKFDVKICKYVVFVAEILVTYFCSITTFHLSPQIKLSKGIGVEVKRSKTKVKLCKILHSSFVSWHKTEKRAATRTTNNDVDLCMMDENETNSASQKCPKSMAQATISQKRAKGKLIFELKCPSFWLGFQAMNWTNRAKDYSMDSMELTSELIKRRMEIEEATKCQQTIPSFPFVIQEEWPSKREDGIEGQHFNLTQIPFDVAVDEHGFALDYQIIISFEIGDLKLPKEVILEKVKERLNKMKIEVGELIGEPIAVLCFHKSSTWSGVVKIHLKNPKKNGTTLFQGSRAFILTLDENVARRGKVCKSYDALALNNLFLVKNVSENLKGREWYKMFEDVVTKGFKRGHEFEITNVQKKTKFDFAWVVAPSPEQTKKINTYKVALDNEVLDVKFTKREKLTEDHKARKNALILIVKNLNKIKNIEELEEHMGEKNVVSTFFKLEGGKHVGSYNV